MKARSSDRDHESGKFLVYLFLERRISAHVVWQYEWIVSSCVALLLLGLAWFMCGLPCRVSPAVAGGVVLYAGCRLAYSEWTSAREMTRLRKLFPRLSERC